MEPARPDVRLGDQEAPGCPSIIFELALHLDEVLVRINAETHSLWRAVDYEGEVLEAFVTHPVIARLC